LEYAEAWQKAVELSKLESQIENLRSKRTSTVEEEAKKGTRLRRLQRQHGRLKAWFKPDPKQREIAVALNECQQLLDEINECRGYVCNTLNDREQRDQKIRSLTFELVKVISKHFEGDYHKAAAALSGQINTPGLEDYLTYDEFREREKGLDPKASSRRDQQIKVILDVIAKLGFEAHAVESKKKVKEICLERRGLFTDSGFDHAWKEAGRCGLIRIREAEKYRQRSF
jgi:hypothetical protein